MSISLDEVRHVAKLARLELNEEELVDFQGKLNALLGHFEDIQGLDVSNQEPKPHAVSMINVLAEDIARPGIPRDRGMANTADSKAGLFIVPTIIEE